MSPELVSSVQSVIGTRAGEFSIADCGTAVVGSYVRSADGCVWIPFATSTSKFPSTQKGLKHWRTKGVVWNSSKPPGRALARYFWKAF